MVSIQQISNSSVEICRDNNILKEKKNLLEMSRNCIIGITFNVICFNFSYVIKYDLACLKVAILNIIDTCQIEHALSSWNKMVPSCSTDGSIVSIAPPWPVPQSHSCCQSSYKENSQWLLQENFKIE